MLVIDQKAIARLGHRHHVHRLSLFGSAVTDNFDPRRSDADFLVESDGAPGTHFDNYFWLKEDLEALLRRSVDLVMRSALENPYFTASVTENAVEIHAA